VNCPMTSSAGRLFDAVAALAGIRDRVSYEGQAAMELEWLATPTASDASYPFDLESSPAHDSEKPALLIDTRPLIAAWSMTCDAPPRSPDRRRFQTTMVEIIAAVCARIRHTTGIDTVVLSGGVFLNALLTEEATARLAHDGFHVHRHRLVPPNDAGLSLGQLAIAAHHQLLEHSSCGHSVGRDDWEGEAPAEPSLPRESGSAGASPSQIPPRSVCKCSRRVRHSYNRITGTSKCPSRQAVVPDASVSHGARTV